MKQFATEHLMSWEYIAGFFDGEGCIYRFNKNGSKIHSFRAFMSQNNKSPLYAIQSFLTDYNIDSIMYKGGRTESQLRITKQQDVLNFLDNILPYLIVKRQKALDTINILTEYMESGGRWKTIKHRGEILEMRKEGLTYKEIKNLLGISVGAIWRVVHA